MDYVNLNLPSNNVKTEVKEPTKKIEVVPTGSVTVKPKNKLAKFVGYFVHEDIKTVRKYIIEDVLIPRTIDLVSDIVNKGTNMFLYGEKGRPSANNTGSSASWTKYYKIGEKGNSSISCVSQKSTKELDDIVFENREDAENCLTALCESIAQYHVARVPDLYEMLGLTCEHTLNNYGWRDLSTARTERVTNGYVIKLPKAEPINR